MALRGTVYAPVGYPEMPIQGKLYGDKRQGPWALWGGVYGRDRI